MQNLKERFRNKDGGRKGTLQSCVRTNDLHLVGDGTHLTYFEMLGNFSFGNNDYARSIEMWDKILSDLDPLGSWWDLLTIHVHPDSNHRGLWPSDYHVIDDPECVWSDGLVGGYCSEVYLGDLEIGNLVNPMGHSTDVGFGWERILMVLEGKKRVDETSLFDQSLTPMQRDHVRTLNSFWLNKVSPGNKGRNYVCRRLLRRLLPLGGDYPFLEWLESEGKLREKCLMKGRKMWRRHKDKPVSWWWETCGLTQDDLGSISEF